MPEANDRLRGARERVESPRSPGYPMTRQELADAVNAQVYRSRQIVTQIDANHIGKWERGAIRWPAEHYRAALRAVLDAATDTDLGFRRPRDGCTSSGVDRKTFLRVTTGLGVGAALGRSADLPATEGLAESIAGPTEHYRRMESSVSSQHLAPAAEGHLRLAREVVQSSSRNAYGYAVLSEAAGLAAWLAADRGDSATARARYTESIQHAESARNPLLVSYMIGSLGHYAVEVGDPRQGVRLLGKAERYQNTYTPAAARAWLASLQAVAYGAIGDRSTTVEMLRKAERYADRSAVDAQWPWVFTFTAAKIARYQSSALARIGDLSGARTAYSAAIPAIAAPKPQALAKVEHAKLLAEFKRDDDAAQLALEALHTGKQYDSERIVSGVRAVRARLSTRSPAAGDLDNLLIELYDRSPGDTLGDHGTPWPSG